MGFYEWAAITLITIIIVLVWMADKASTMRIIALREKIDEDAMDYARHETQLALIRAQSRMQDWINRHEEFLHIFGQDLFRFEFARFLADRRMELPTFFDEIPTSDDLHTQRWYCSTIERIGSSYVSREAHEPYLKDVALVCNDETDGSFAELVRWFVKEQSRD